MYYKRTPSKSPYYDYFDATRDIGYSLSDNAKYNQKMPLIIIVDTGSGEEDAFPIQKVKLFGCQVVVIDHHVPGKNDPISKLADAHINPHLVGDEYSYSAGMLCAEVARKINKDAPNIDYIPALSGLSDRIESDELAQYIAIAEKQGYSREYLEKLGTVIDFEAWNFKFDESRELVDILFGSDRDLQKKTVELLHPEITRRFARQLAINQHNCEIKMVKNVVLAKLDIGQNANFNTYPPAGKSLSSLHDWVQTQHPGKPVLSIGYASDFVTIRATDGTNFSIIGFVDRVQKKFPYGGIDGGGHEHAGSIKAIPSIMPKVLQEFETVLAESQ
jgi:RecJ-like exonuclease